MTRRLPLLRGGGLPGRILAPGTPSLTPRVPFLLSSLVIPLLTPLLAPLVTPLPLVVAPPPSPSPSSPLSPSSKASRMWTSASSRVRKTSSPGNRKVPPSFSLLLFFPFFPFFPPSPLDPCGTTHQFPGSSSSSHTPPHCHLVDGPPIAPLRPRDIPGVPHTRHIPIGVRAPTFQGGLGFEGGCLALGLGLGLGWGGVLPCYSRSGGASWAFWGPCGGAWVPWGGFFASLLVLVLLVLVLVRVLVLVLLLLLPPSPTHVQTLRRGSISLPPHSSPPPTYPTRPLVHARRPNLVLG